MRLCHPDPRCLCRLQCHDHSCLAKAIPPLPAASFCHHCQLLSSHSCYCQPLLTFTSAFNGWLLHPSLLRHLLPAPSSAAPIIDTFVANRCAVLFLICIILFSIAPFLLQWWSSLPPPLLTLAPRCASLVLWCGCLSSILAGCCVTSHHAAASCLPAPLPVILLLPLVVRHD